MSYIYFTILTSYFSGKSIIKVFIFSYYLMKILWTKFRCHDSSIFYIDTVAQEIFAMSTERVTRIKHDKHPIEKILEEYPFLKNVEYVWHTYCMDDTIEELKNSELRRMIQRVYQPQYIKNLAGVYSEVETDASIKKRLIDQSQQLCPEVVSRYKLYQSLQWVAWSAEYDSLSTKYFKQDIARVVWVHEERVSLHKHHLCHAHWSYCMSPFYGNATGVFVLDGRWDEEYSTLWSFNDQYTYKQLWSSKTWLQNNDTIFEVVSIGNVYSLITETIGLHHRSDEGKVEALAAFGMPDQELMNTFHSCFVINTEKNCWDIDLEVAKKVFSTEFLTSEYNRLWKEDLCASVQVWLEDTVVTFLTKMQEKHQFTNMIICGWVMANVITNMKIFQSNIFDSMYVNPCMSDEWSWIGAATLIATQQCADISRLYKHTMPYRWDEIDSADIQRQVHSDERSGRFTAKYVWDNRPIEAARFIPLWKIVALVQWRMEFGPRALGNRSITADPTCSAVKDIINLHIKKRPWYQPFCPSILEEEREKLFQNSYESKHMAIAFKFKDEYKDILPWAMHIDGTARPQFVSLQDNPQYYRYIQEVKKYLGYGVVVNTSFNKHGRTIVRTAHDAITDFLDCGIDVLVLWGRILQATK